MITGTEGGAAGHEGSRDQGSGSGRASEEWEGTSAGARGGTGGVHEGAARLGGRALRGAWGRVRARARRHLLQARADRRLVAVGADHLLRLDVPADVPRAYAHAPPSS